MMESDILRMSVILKARMSEWKDEKTKAMSREL